MQLLLGVAVPLAARWPVALPSQNGKQTMADYRDALEQGAYALGILHGLKMADADAWDAARQQAERMLTERRQVLLGDGEQAVKEK